MRCQVMGKSPHALFARTPCPRVLSVQSAVCHGVGLSPSFKTSSRMRHPKHDCHRHVQDVGASNIGSTPACGCFGALFPVLQSSLSNLRPIPVTRPIVVFLACLAGLSVVLGPWSSNSPFFLCDRQMGLSTLQENLYAPSFF